MRLTSNRKLARQLGVSDTSVRRAESAGRIAREADGSWDLAKVEAAWRAVLDDLLAGGMAKPELVIVDGGKGLEAALASLWADVPVQRCTVHKERNLLAHAPKHLHDEIKANVNDMVHAKTAVEVLAKRKLFLAKWKLRCQPVAKSLEEAGDRMFTFVRYPPNSGAR